MAPVRDRAVTPSALIVALISLLGLISLEASVRAGMFSVADGAPRAEASARETAKAVSRIQTRIAGYEADDSVPGGCSPEDRPIWGLSRDFFCFNPAGVRADALKPARISPAIGRLRPIKDRPSSSRGPPWSI
jgi:hypothetical protein